MPPSLACAVLPWSRIASAAWSPHAAAPRRVSGFHRFPRQQPTFPRLLAWWWRTAMSLFSQFGAPRWRGHVLTVKSLALLYRLCARTALHACLFFFLCATRSVADSEEDAETLRHQRWQDLHREWVHEPRSKDAAWRTGSTTTTGGFFRQKKKFHCRRPFRGKR